MAHLLELTKLSNVMVVVSRWFGGILLGPDRCVQKYFEEIMCSFLSMSY